VLCAGISGVKSREDLVMSTSDLSANDPFSAAPFKPPAGNIFTASFKHCTANYELFLFLFHIILLTDIPISVYKIL